jgi:fido (protein-threonine AMPylation protein)
MKKLIDLIHPFRLGNTRFERYYAAILGDGVGYPTADEARKDLRRLDLTTAYTRWTF